jgi:thioesterase domain-containing protein
MNYTDLKNELQNKLHDEILPTKTLDFRVDAMDGERLTLSAPLEVNINDKGTAFGGSIASLCTITGWCMCWTIAKLQDIECDMVVFESNMTYSRPITKDFIAEVLFPSEEQIQTIKAKMDEKGKASMELEVVINENGKNCVKYTGKYAFISKAKV